LRREWFEEKKENACRLTLFARYSGNGGKQEGVSSKDEEGKKSFVDTGESKRIALGREEMVPFTMTEKKSRRQEKSSQAFRG